MANRSEIQSAEYGRFAMTPEEKKLSQATPKTKAVNQLKAGKQLPEARGRLAARSSKALGN